MAWWQQFGQFLLTLGRILHETDTKKRTDKVKNKRLRCIWGPFPSPEL